MALEIELKVRLADHEPVKKRLFALGDYYCSYEKSDSYWFPEASVFVKMPDILSGVRVRREKNVRADGTEIESFLVTHKTKDISGGLEVNEEREFVVSDAGRFEELLGRLGLYKENIGKEKRGWSWVIPSGTAGCPSVLAELSNVIGLGWFLELEIIAGENARPVVEEHRKLLFSLLEKLEIPADRIESRPYTAMLSAAGCPVPARG
ncbi:MAG: hypothetical protein FWH38_07480 [Treponema sp.]|nr:hypothetical protein [Treponema sp.]